MPGVQEKLYDAIKQAAPHLKDFLSCALPPPDSEEQGLQAQESISRISGFPRWKELHIRHKVIYSHCCHQTFSDRMQVSLSFGSMIELDF